jgi:hypothetical protein
MPPEAPSPPRGITPEGIAMPAAEAHVPTDNPGRYLIQLCRHAQQVTRMRHRPPAHGGGTWPRPQVHQADWSETEGSVSFGWGTCTLRAAPGMLTLRAEAIDTDHLRRVQQIVTADLERFGRREHVQVIWHEQVPAG